MELHVENRFALLARFFWMFKLAFIYFLELKTKLSFFIYLNACFGGGVF